MGSSDINGCINILNDQKSSIVEEYGPNLKLLPTNDQVKELQTILRDRLVYKCFEYVALQI